MNAEFSTFLIFLAFVLRVFLHCTSGAVDTGKAAPDHLQSPNLLLASELSLKPDNNMGDVLSAVYILIFT
ncbi:MAG: hypothetical protein ABJN26_26020 [Stappiaceae bacterium]